MFVHSFVFFCLVHLDFPLQFRPQNFNKVQIWRARWSFLTDICYSCILWHALRKGFFHAALPNSLLCKWCLTGDFKTWQIQELMKLNLKLFSLPLLATSQCGGTVYSWANFRHVHFFVALIVLKSFFLFCVESSWFFFQGHGWQIDFTCVQPHMYTMGTHDMVKGNNSVPGDWKEIKQIKCIFQELQFVCIYFKYLLGLSIIYNLQ